MPRIRTIKPEFFRHHDLYLAEKKSKLPIRVAFSGLWCCADKEGRFKWKPTELKLDILPYDEVDFILVLQCLLDNEFIVKYTIGKSDYGFIPKFTEHQRITGTEKNYESKIPAYINGSVVESLSVSLESHVSTVEVPEKSQPIDNQTAFQSASLETSRQVGMDNIGKENQERSDGDSQSSSLEMTSVQFEEYKIKLLADKLFVEPMMMAKGMNNNIADLEYWVTVYHAHISGEGKTEKDYSDYKRHFKNWFSRQDISKKHQTANNGQPKIRL